eukprot:CAMPEP_0171082716 /NCGR_PEP_ID=MMETSP0766_2-20121228/17279_1 /TAXON_ID=439317 /ORGANISM="Gambierdiscus australes, Strain CAWD 149" /LENGTH=136 /DNA_ID=CAMNT_0011540101 /DNA_START=64 /DNA_END=474 /DNA_ORIENTATION=-
MSGVTVSDACVELYNQIKMKKDLRYVTFQIQNNKEIIPDKQGPNTETYADFTKQLPESEPRYALVDVEFTSADGRPQSKLCFVFWSPDDKTTVKQRMIYASSKDAIKKKLTGIMKEIQANDASDLAEEDVKKKMAE